MGLAEDALFSPAQTNTALYIQLHEAGYSVPDIIRAQHAYRLSCKLFNGRYRKTERPFICHAIGAASSAARFDKGIHRVIAAMLHATYDSGQFPDGRTGKKTDAHRAFVKEQVGEEVEAIVARYDDFSFELGVPEKMVERLPPDDQLDLLFMALVHEVDDMADGGLFFAAKYGHSIGSRAEACAILAERIAQPELAATIRSHAKKYLALGWTSDLEVKQLEGFRVAPNLAAYWRLRLANWRGKSVQVI